MSIDFHIRSHPRGDAHEHEHGRDPDEHDVVSIRHNVVLNGVVGGLALVVGLNFLFRGSVLDVLVGLVLVGIAALNAPALLAPTAPVLVVDEQGIRFRLGTSWRGLPWREVRQVVVEHPESLLRDGRLVVVPREPEEVLDELDALGRLHVRWNELWYGAAVALPLGRTTVVDVPDLAGELLALSDGRAEVVVVEPEVPETHAHGAHAADPVAPVASAGPLHLDVAVEEEYDDEFGEDFRAELHGVGPEYLEHLEHADENEATGPLAITDLPEVVAGEVVDLPVPPEPDEPTLPAAVLPLRDLSSPARFDVRLPEPVVPSQRVAEELEEPLVLAAWDHEAPIDLHDSDEAGGTEDAEPVVLAAVTSRPEPIIGQKIAHARQMLDMSIDELSQRTRIRPHVLEAIEQDDFVPCGGDFYARGHLTAVSRVLGLTLEPLLKIYDEHYAQAPINARRVFEAELSTGLSGGMRATLGGPRWSLVIGAVLSLTMIWAVARMFAGSPAELNAAPDPGSHAAGLSANHTPITSERMKPTAMTVTAAHAAAHLVVRDRTEKVLWSGYLALGKHRRILGVAPFRVTADNGGAIEVSVKGKVLGTAGTAGVSATRSFG